MRLPAGRTARSFPCPAWGADCRTVQRQHHACHAGEPAADYRTIAQGQRALDEREADAQDRSLGAQATIMTARMGGTETALRYAIQQGYRRGPDRGYRRGCCCSGGWSASRTLGDPVVRGTQNGVLA